MEGETSWVSHCFDNVPRNSTDFDFSAAANDDDGGLSTAVPVDSILPDDLLERILAYLPIASVFRVGSVCKRWHEIVTSRRFLWHASPAAAAQPQPPWYFMFTSCDEPVGYAYDPVLRKWHGIALPHAVKTSRWFVASSRGLVCFMDNDGGGPRRREVYACNPITRAAVRLPEPPGPRFPDYTALAIDATVTAAAYRVAVVKSKQVPGNYFQWDLSIHVYDSAAASWATAAAEVVTGWRGGEDGVICNRVLYFLVYATGSGGPPENRHGVVGYDLVARRARGLLVGGFVPVPCALTCGRLMNLNGTLVMVGGIGKPERADIIKGIGVWALAENGRGWAEVGRMPHKYFQGFGEFDEVFASGGGGDLVYIQSYGAPALLVFDVKTRRWRWALKCPVAKRFPLQLFSGFCFEPRLDTLP